MVYSQSFYRPRVAKYTKTFDRSRSVLLVYSEYTVSAITDDKYTSSIITPFVLHELKGIVEYTFDVGVLFFLLQ